MGAVVADTERRRVESTLVSAADEPWAADLKAYRAHLAAGRMLALKTMRVYVAAAAAWLRASRVKGASELTQRHLARHLRRSRGRRNNLLSFLAWVTGISGNGFDLGRARRTPDRKLEKATLKKAAVLLDSLKAAGSRREHRALKDAATGVLDGLPLSEVLALRRSHATGDGRATAVCCSGPVELANVMATQFHWTSAALGRLAFSGRNGVQPLSAAAVRHHLLPMRPRQ